MIKYSRARVIFLIIVVIALWITASYSHPYTEKRVVRVDANMGRVTVIADTGHVEVRASSDGMIHIHSDVEEYSIQSGSYSVEEAEEVIIYLPSSTRDLSLSATGSAYIHSLSLDSLSASNSEEELSLSNVTADNLTITSLDGDVDIWDISAEEVEVSTTSSSIYLHSSHVSVITATTSSGNVDIDLPSFDKASIVTVSGDVSISVDDISSYSIELSSPQESASNLGTGDGLISITTTSGSITLE